MSVFSQKDLAKGFIITEKNDTIFGKLKAKDYYSVGRVILYADHSRISYSKNELKEINLNTEKSLLSEQ